jgi:hypothetical protein
MSCNAWATVAISYLIGTTVLSCAIAAGQQAAADIAPITGVYNGTYACAQGPRTLRLTLTATGEHTLEGLFTFYMPPKSHDHPYSYTLKGSYDEAGNFHLEPVQWKTPPPPGYMMIGLKGEFDADSGKVQGNITNGMCAGFEAKREGPPLIARNAVASAPTGQGATAQTPAQSARAATAPASQAGNAAANPAASAEVPASDATTPETITAKATSASIHKNFQRSYYCMDEIREDPRSPKINVYVSEVFLSSSTPTEITAAWRDYLTRTYHVTRFLMVCTEVASREAVKGPQGMEANNRDQWQRMAASERWRGVPPDKVSQRTLVDTQWKYVDLAGQASGGTIDGVYSGEFFCGNLDSGGGVFKLTLASTGNSLNGIVEFDLGDLNHGRIHYSVSGSYDPALGKFRLVPGKWLNEINGRPIQSPMNTFDGTFDAKTGKLTGQTKNTCSGSYPNTYPETFKAKAEPLPSTAPVQPPAPSGSPAIASGGKGAAMRGDPNAQAVARATVDTGPCSNTSWPLKGVDFVNAVIVRSFYTGQLQCIPQQPWQVMSYITAMNDTLGKLCPKLNDPSITNAAQQTVNVRTQSDALHNWPGANLAGLRVGLESQALYRNSGQEDAQAVYDHAPDKCKGEVVNEIVGGMRSYVQSH